MRLTRCGAARGVQCFRCMFSALNRCGATLAGLGICVKLKPATPLPYFAALTEIVTAEGVIVAQVMIGPNAERDAAYLAHAANAYRSRVEPEDIGG